MNTYELIIITTFCALISASAASFINVAALRGAKEESYVAGRSCCPACNKTLRWFELIPIFSWLMLLGRCGGCRTRISPRYLIIELIAATATVLCFTRFGLTWTSAIGFAVMLLLLAVAVIDLDTMEIPNGLIIALIPFAIATIWASPEVSLISRIIGLFVISLPMLVLALIIDGAFGGGDIKLMAVCGFLLGWQQSILAFFIAIIIGGTIALTMMRRDKAKKGARLPFGPSLCLGITAAMLYGDKIISSYLGLLGL